MLVPYGYYIGHAGRIPLYVEPSALLLPILLWMGFSFSLVWFFAALLVVVVSVVLHELGHGVAAVATNMRDVRIALTGLGGYCTVDEAARPWQRVVVTACGPLVTFFLAGLGWLSLQIILAYSPDLLFTDAGPSRLNIVLSLIWNINLFLGIYNMLPIYPMDGGQILLFVQRSCGLRMHLAARNTLIVSVVAVVGVLIALHHLQMDGTFIILLLGSNLYTAFTTLGSKR